MSKGFTKATLLISFQPLFHLFVLDITALAINAALGLNSIQYRKCSRANKGMALYWQLNH